MKKIIHLIQSLDNGGCENMLLRTLPLFDNFKHLIITLRNKGELADKFEEKNIKVINIGRQGILDIKNYLRFIKTIKNIKPDIIVTYLFHADIIGRLIIQPCVKAPIVPYLRTTYNHEKYKKAQFAEKLTKYLVKKYLANSKAVKNFYEKNIGVPKNKITVIPNGIDTKIYDKISYNENLRKKLNIMPAEMVIISVANFHVNKGHKYLLKAFEKVYGKNKKIKLILVGDGEEKENLQKQIKDYSSKNNILFLGQRNDVPNLLKISNIFVLPTLFEGLSNALMEAMTSGLPVITTDIPENKELIKNNKTGLLIPVKNSSDLAKAIEKLLSDSNSRDNLGNKARNKIIKKFDIQVIVKKLNNFYSDL